MHLSTRLYAHIQSADVKPLPDVLKMRLKRPDERDEAKQGLFERGELVGKLNERVLTGMAKHEDRGLNRLQKLFNVMRISTYVQVDVEEARSGVVAACHHMLACRFGILAQIVWHGRMDAKINDINRRGLRCP